MSWSPMVEPHPSLSAVFQPVQDLYLEVPTIPETLPRMALLLQAWRIVDS